jgi:hypothetical protein
MDRRRTRFTTSCPICAACAEGKAAGADFHGRTGRALARVLERRPQRDFSPSHGRWAFRIDQWRRTLSPTMRPLRRVLRTTDLCLFHSSDSVSRSHLWTDRPGLILAQSMFRYHAGGLFDFRIDFWPTLYTGSGPVRSSDRTVLQIEGGLSAVDCSAHS